MPDLMTPLDLSANSVAFAELIRRSVLIADESAVSDIEMLADEVYLNGGPTRWYDVRPMLNPNEMSGELVDMNAARIDYAVQRKLVALHPEASHLVRITARGR